VHAGGRRYSVQVQRRSPTAFCVTLNGSSSVEVTTRKMAGGAFLLQACHGVCVSGCQGSAIGEVVEQAHL